MQQLVGNRLSVPHGHFRETHLLLTLAEDEEENQSEDNQRRYDEDDQYDKQRKEHSCDVFSVNLLQEFLDDWSGILVVPFVDKIDVAGDDRVGLRQCRVAESLELVLCRRVNQFFLLYFLFDNPITSD